MFFDRQEYTVAVTEIEILSVQRFEEIILFGEKREYIYIYI